MLGTASAISRPWSKGRKHVRSLLLPAARTRAQGTPSRARFFSTIETVPLAYELHEPAKPVTDRQRAPILFMHGLFGSKKNNRTMSK